MYDVAFRNCAKRRVEDNFYTLEKLPSKTSQDWENRTKRIDEHFLAHITLCAIGGDGGNAHREKLPWRGDGWPARQIFYEWIREAWYNKSEIHEWSQNTRQ